MTPTKHAQLLRDLISEIQSFYCGPVPLMCPALIARAAQALRELEGREAPTDEEVIEFWNLHCAGDGDPGIIKLARFGAGEGES